MESSTSYIGVESNRVSTEVDYTNTIDPKPTPDKRNNMGNVEKICFWKNRGRKILEVENEKTEIHIIHLKKKLHTIKKRGEQFYH